jgi:hypothetical protein
MDRIGSDWQCVGRKRGAQYDTPLGERYLPLANLVEHLVCAKQLREDRETKSFCWFEGLKQMQIWSAA